MNATIDQRSLQPRAAPPTMLASLVDGLPAQVACPSHEWRRLLAAVGLTPEAVAEPQGLVPLDSGMAAFEAVAGWAHRPTLGIDYAKSLAVGGAGPLGFAIVSAGNVREALAIIARFVPVVASMRYCRYEQDDAAGSIVWEYPQGTIPGLQFVSFGVAASMQRIRGALGDSWRPHAVVMGCRPPAERGAFEEHFGPGLEIAPSSRPFRLSVQTELLDTPMPAANPRLFAMVTRLAEIDRRRRGVYATELEGRLRAVIPRLLQKGQTSAGDLAAAMGMSTGRLRQQLNANGLDFRTLLDDVRREAALDYLHETDLPVADIAFRLGYADGTVFARACQKWFGQTPRDVRG